MVIAQVVCAVCYLELRNDQRQLPAVTRSLVGHYLSRARMVPGHWLLWLPALSYLSLLSLIMMISLQHFLFLYLCISLSLSISLSTSISLRGVIKHNAPSNKHTRLLVHCISELPLLPLRVHVIPCITTPITTTITTTNLYDYVIHIYKNHELIYNFIIPVEYVLRQTKLIILQLSNIRSHS